MGLWISDSGVPAYVIERGVAAAQQRFVDLGHSPEACNSALDDFNIAEDPESLPAETLRMVAAWESAEKAAISACFRYGNTRYLESAQLVWE